MRLGSKYMKNLKLKSLFLCMGFDCLKATEPLHKRIKYWNNVDLEVTQQIWTWEPELGIWHRDQ